MILILSKEVAEITTETVMDWIEYLGGKCFRLNGEDLVGDARIMYHLSDTNDGLTITCNNNEVQTDDINIIWYRRSVNDISNYITTIEDNRLATAINRHLAREYFTFYEVLGLYFQNKEWLNHPQKTKVNKINLLLKAKKAGLNIPETTIANNKYDFLKFLESQNTCITKPISESTYFVCNEQAYPMLTEKISKENIENLDSQIFPSLVQEYIAKEFEIRVFYLNEECFSMAIFSQSDPQTQIDFRNYNHRKPNRFVPYKLPLETEGKIRAFMKDSDQNCGSLDLIKSVDGRIVFLEVNPIGQFGMVSYPCNYNLEEKVAEYLIKLDKQHERRERD